MKGILIGKGGVEEIEQQRRVENGIRCHCGGFTL